MRRLYHPDPPYEGEKRTIVPDNGDPEYQVVLVRMLKECTVDGMIAQLWQIDRWDDSVKMSYCEDQIWLEVGKLEDDGIGAENWHMAGWCLGDLA